MSELQKDILIGCRSVKQGLNSKNNMRLQLYFTPEVCDQLATVLAEKNKEGDRGVKIDFHTNKTTLDDGRVIEGGFLFVKATQSMDAPRQGTNSYTPKASTEEVAARLANKQVG